MACDAIPKSFASLNADALSRVARARISGAFWKTILDPSRPGKKLSFFLTEGPPLDRLDPPPFGTPSGLINRSPHKTADRIW